MSSHKRAAESNEESSLYDINETSTFDEWLGKSMRQLGANGNGAFTQQAITQGKLDPEIARCENLSHDLTFLAPGKTHNGITYAAGLTVGQLRMLEPLPPRNQRVDTEKTRAAYIRDSATAINFVKLRMQDHTIAYFENTEAFNEAVDKRDLVAFGHILKSRGIIGTGDIDEARLKLEKEIYEVASDMKLESQGPKGFDFNQHSIHYRRIAKNLKELGSQVGEKSMVRSYLLSLPGKTIRTQLSIGSGAPTTLEGAISTVRGMIIAQNVSLTECAAAFVLDEETKQPKRHKTESADSIEMMVATAVATSMNEIDKRRSAERADRAKGYNERQKAREERAVKFFDRECPQLKSDGMCDYEKRLEKKCKFKHGLRTSNIGGVIKKIAPTSEKPTGTKK